MNWCNAFTASCMEIHPRTRGNILSIINHKIVNFNCFVEDQLIFINTHPKLLDFRVRDVYTFKQWIDVHETCDVVKIEGLELDNIIIKRLSPPIKKTGMNISSIHAFISQKTGYSFKWHTDDEHVLLWVLTGMKRVHLQQKTYTLNNGDCVFMKKGQYHKVFSKKGTVALSIGIK